MKCPYCIKVCSKCGEILVANKMNFVKAKTGKYGLKSQCKQCNKQQRKEYYQNNVEYFKEYQKEYRKNNVERIKEQHKEYRKNNVERIKEQKKEYYKNNVEYFKEYHKGYYKNNAEEIKEYNKEYRKNNPDKVFNNSNKRRQRENSQGMGINKEQWLDMMNHFNWECAYSGKPLNKDNRSIDHVKPLVKGGLNEIFNCVPCDKSINSSKHDKDFMEWYKGQEFYDESRLQRIYEWQQYCLETYYEYIKIS